MVWAHLMQTAGGREVLATGTEVQITVMLQDALEELLNAGSLEGFSAAFFVPPVRGQELDDYSGCHLEKRPDLTFLRHSAVPSTRHNGLFYECKLLGRGRKLKDYIENGVARFEDGRYAWAMPHAGMLAYLGDAAYTGNAEKELDKCWKSYVPPALHAPVGAVVTDETSSPLVAVTLHPRTFLLPSGRSPGDVELWHLWLPGPVALAAE